MPASSSRRLYATSAAKSVKASPAFTKPALSAKAHNATVNTVFQSKCQEAIRSKRAQFPAQMPPACVNTQKTLIPYYTSPRKNSALTISLPVSIFDESNNIKSRFEREQRLEMELWVKAAYLHEFQSKKGLAKEIKLRPLVEEFTKSGKCDPYLSFYMEKHRKELMPIVRELTMRRNDVLRHQTFGAVEKKNLQYNEADEDLFMATDSGKSNMNRVTIEDLKAAVQRIQSAQKPEEQTIAVQHYMSLRAKYVDPASAENQSYSHLTASEALHKRTQAQLQQLFEEIVVKKRSPAQLANQIRTLKQNYQRMQRVSTPTEEIDLFDVYALEKTMMDPVAATKRFIQKAKSASAPRDNEMKQKLMALLEKQEKDLQKSLPSDKHRQVRAAYLKALEARHVLENPEDATKKAIQQTFRDFMDNHKAYIEGALNLLAEQQKEFAPLYDVLKKLYQEKQRVTESDETPFRHPTHIRGAFDALDLSNLQVDEEVEHFERIREAQMTYLEAHYARCAEILPQQDYQTKYLEQFEILLSRVASDPTLSAAVRELADMAQDAASQQGLATYETSAGTVESFHQDITYLSHMGELSKHVKRVNSLQSVFGVRAIDKSLELLDTYDVTLEPPRYRRYIQSSMPAYKLRYLDTYSAHPTKKERRTDRKVQLICSKHALQQKLTPAALDRFINLAGHFYKSNKAELLLSSEIFPTRQENRQYVVNLLGALVREAQKADLHSDYIVPAQPAKLSALEKLAVQYPNLDEEDVQSHELLGQWLGYLRKGKIAGADEMYGEGIEHQEALSFDQQEEEEQIDFESITELSGQEFEVLFEKLKNMDVKKTASPSEQVEDVVVEEISVPAAEERITTKVPAEEQI